MKKRNKKYTIPNLGEKIGAGTVSSSLFFFFFNIVFTQVLNELLCCVRTWTSQVYYTDQFNHIFSKPLCPITLPQPTRPKPTRQPSE